jgi:hypothetical protein
MTGAVALGVLHYGSAAAIHMCIGKLSEKINITNISVNLISPYFKLIYLNTNYFFSCYIIWILTVLVLSLLMIWRRYIGAFIATCLLLQLSLFMLLLLVIHSSNELTILKGPLVPR